MVILALAAKILVDSLVQVCVCVWVMGHPHMVPVVLVPADTVGLVSSWGPHLSAALSLQPTPCDNRVWLDGPQTNGYQAGEAENTQQWCPRCLRQDYSTPPQETPKWSFTEGTKLHFCE